MVANEEKILNYITLTTEPGVIGGTLFFSQSL